MTDEPKRVDLRFGDVAISVRGFDDPIGPVKQVLRFVQRVVEETPELTKLSLTLDDDEIASLVENVSHQLEMRDGELEITPGLIVAAKSAVAETEEQAPAPVPPMAEPVVEPSEAAPVEDYAEEEPEPEPEPVAEYLESMSGPDASERIFEDVDPEPANVSDELQAEAEAHRDFGAAIEPPYEAEPEPEPEPRVINIFGDPSERRRAPEPEAETPLRRRPEAAEGGDPLSFLRRRKDSTEAPQEDAPAAETATNIFAEPEATPVESAETGLGGMTDRNDWQEEAPSTEIAEPEPASVNIFADNADVAPAEPAPLDPAPVEAEFDRQSILRAPEPDAELEPDLGAAPPPTKGSSRFEALVARYRRDPGQSEEAEPAGSAMAPRPTMESPAGELNAPAASGGISPGDLAQSAGATTVPELLGAAAAWLSVIKGQNRFARRDVMAVFDEIPGDHARSLEARIKGYGKLVRNGVLVLVDDGMFALSEDERERFKDLLS